MAAKLRTQTEETDTMTIPNFLSRKLGDDKGYIRTFSAVVILFFFTVYSSSGLVAAGKLFASILGIDYKLAVLIGVYNYILYIYGWIFSLLLDRFFPRNIDVFSNFSCSSCSLFSWRKN